MKANEKRSDLILEKRHAKFMVDFFKIHKHTAHSKYNFWLSEYNRLKLILTNQPN
jgi:hypothetical protein